MPRDPVHESQSPAPARPVAPKRVARIRRTVVPLLIASLVGIVPACVVPPARAAAPQFLAGGFKRRTVYHSPQKPGYTSWVGAWVMPDESLMICFTQATGPLTGRPRAPRDVLQKLGLSDAGRDFTGLEREEIYLRSTDGGAHWSRSGVTPFAGVGASAYAGGATTALPDGDILRRVNGWDLLGVPSVPPTAFLQHSADGAKTWSPPQVLLDPAKALYQLSRIRRLADGRLVATGQLWPVPAASSHKELEKVSAKLLLMVSADSGRTWQRRDVAPAASFPGVAWDEWDFAELPGGDLLCVFRRGDPTDPRREVRWQGLLKKKDDGWRLTQFRASALPHSGHPELLAAREGIILYFATTGVQWTADAGETWTPLEAPGLGAYKSRYYPRSLQTRDGAVYVFAHNGWDNRYGEFDQSIDMDTFRLVRK